MINGTSRIGGDRLLKYSPGCNMVEKNKENRNGCFMKKFHEREKKQFKKLFSQEELRDFDARLSILEIFLQADKHVTVTELNTILKSKGYDFDSAFIRDTLKMLCHYGFARKHRFDDGIVRYEPWHLEDHHDHMICMKCGEIIEFRDDQLEKIQEDVAATQGFHMLQHRMEIYGICADCLNKRDRIVPLVRAKQGEKVTIEEFSGGANARVRLMSMGLRVGDMLDVITSDTTGQLVVAAGNKRYAIGRGLAKKIQVRAAGK
jgi:Fur family ferric uptake transcriptional regulator